MKNIELRGVRQNNLKNINVDIPLRSFVVICGPSGSGKSSLAFQTLFAEGQRRYLESLSNYAKQFIQTVSQPDLDSAHNIPPSIALEQKNAIRSSRSTVGTHSELYDHLRVLFSRVGKPYCSTHHTVMQKHTPDSAGSEVLNLLSEKRVYVLAQVKEWASVAEQKEWAKKTLKQGYAKVVEFKNSKIQSQTDLETEPLPKKAKNVFLVMDRLALSKDEKGRLSQSLAQAFEQDAFQRAHVVSTEGDHLVFKKERSCSQCDEDFWELQPELFSFNNPVGACSSCNGFGNVLKLDKNKVIPNSGLSIQEGALSVFEMPSGKKDKKKLLEFCKAQKIDVEEPWGELPKKHQDSLWSGGPKWKGVEGLFKHLEGKKYKMHVRVFLSRFKSSVRCLSCKGLRLRPKLNQVKVAEKSISEVSGFTLLELQEWIENLKLNTQDQKLTQDLRAQMLAKLNFLNSVGLDYLTLLRETRTLSGGEFQRLNLAGQLGMELSDTLYVLDEPTIGLHPRDNHRLIELLNQLHKNQNTLVVVEHDRDVILSGTHVIEMGPESGLRGGEVVYAGPSSKYLRQKTLTTEFLNSKSKGIVKGKKISSKSKFFMLSGCSGHNLKNVTLKLPLNKMTVVTGVSGSGKSSLIMNTLYPALKKKLTGEHQVGGLPYKTIKPDALCSVDSVDQKRIAKTRRSFVATYLKIFDVIRKKFSNLKEAQLLGYGPGIFSVNVEGGRCPDCKGLGIEEVEMLFMDNVELICETCQGKRYKPEVLKLKLYEKSLHDILNFTCDEAKELFKNDKKIHNTLSILDKLGLGYLKLGQGLDTLSGGESQRLKLVPYLMSSQIQNQLLIFDEPSTGLHFNEIEKLISVFKDLVEAGATVVVIEHNMDIMARADWIIDVGPEAGERGGQIVAQGTPSQVIQKSTHTAKYLKMHLS